MFDFITGLVRSTGPLGVLLLMFGENIFPPLPSEVIMPLAGYVAAQGGMTLVAAVAAGTAGSVLGALPWYMLGRRLGRQRVHRLLARHGRWFALSCAEFERAETWFHRHGRKAVFFGRVVPAVRTVISLPAGLSGMPMGPFLLWTTLGSAVWVSALTAAGYLLRSQYHRVEEWIEPAAVAALAVAGLTYAWRVATWKDGQARQAT